MPFSGTYVCTHGWPNGQTDGLTHGRTERRMDERMYVRTLPSVLKAINFDEDAAQK